MLWQQPDSLVFMARGREYRSEFHINPSDEVMYPVKGDLKLHYRTEEGKEEIAEVPEGSVIYTPAGTPHSPRFAPDAYLAGGRAQAPRGRGRPLPVVLPECATRRLHEEKSVVDDYSADPVSKAYQQSFFDSEEARTCKKCGNVMPKPYVALANDLAPARGLCLNMLAERLGRAERQESAPALRAAP